MKGLDYAWSRPNAAGLPALGYSFVCRYLSWLPNGKCIDAAERDSLLAAGIDIALNWEFAAADQLGGASAGTSHATEAVKQAKALGYPAGSAIYFSADIDVTSAQWPTVAAYQRAAKVVCNQAGYRFGVYAGYNVIRWSFDAGIAEDGWQAYAWSLASQTTAGTHDVIVPLRGSNFRFDSRASVRQLTNGVTVLGADCDLNETTGGPLYFWRHTASAAGPTIGDKVLSFLRIKDGNVAGALLVSDGVSYSYYGTEAACRAAMTRAGKTYGRWDAEPTQASVDNGEWGASTVAVDVNALAAAIVAKSGTSTVDANTVRDAVKAALVSTVVTFGPAATPAA